MKAFCEQIWLNRISHALLNLKKKNYTRRAMCVKGKKSIKMLLTENLTLNLRVRNLQNDKSRTRVRISPVGEDFLTRVRALSINDRCKLAAAILQEDSGPEFNQPPAFDAQALKISSSLTKIWTEWVKQRYQMTIRNCRTSECRWNANERLVGNWKSGSAISAEGPATSWISIRTHVGPVWWFALGSHFLKALALKWPNPVYSPLLHSIDN